MCYFTNPLITVFFDRGLPAKFNLLTLPDLKHVRWANRQLMLSWTKAQ